LESPLTFIDAWGLLAWEILVLKSSNCIHCDSRSQKSAKTSVRKIKKAVAVRKRFGKHFYQEVEAAERAIDGLIATR